MRLKISNKIKLPSGNHYNDITGIGLFLFAVSIGIICSLFALLFK